MSCIPMFIASEAAADFILRAESQPLDDRAADPVKGQTGAVSEVGEVRHSHSPWPDTEREIMIIRAGKLSEYFVAEHVAAQKRWNASGHLADKGEADGALMRAKDAQRLMVALINARSPEQLMRMAQAQVERMAREPGAERA
jgi:hypothetical protein